MDDWQRLLEKAQNVQQEIEAEFTRLLDEKREQFHYALQRRGVKFDEAFRHFHLTERIALWQYLRSASLLTILTAPVIYSVLPVFMLLDLMITLYQWICFPVYGIAKVVRRDYVAIDRQYLAYLNLIEKINCMYCGYGNGVLAYAREIAARTEQYWCPIKHARRLQGQHARSYRFVDYGDVEAWKQRLPALRTALAETDTPRP